MAGGGGGTQVKALDKDVHGLVQSLLPDANDAAKRAGLLARLQSIAEAACPDLPGARLMPFGSSVSGLHGKGADLDLTLVVDGGGDIEMEVRL